MKAQCLFYCTLFFLYSLPFFTALVLEIPFVETIHQSLALVLHLKFLHNTRNYLYWWFSECHGQFIIFFSHSRCTYSLWKFFLSNLFTWGTIFILIVPNYYFQYTSKCMCRCLVNLCCICQNKWSNKIKYIKMIFNSYSSELKAIVM